MWHIAPDAGNARFEFEYYADRPAQSRAGNCAVSQGD
jgi:hypothetical protein